jgi:hypothetical protein
MPAEADPGLALRLAKAAADLYGQATDRMLAIVARRLASGIDEPGWAEVKLAEMASLRDEARAVIERIDVLGPRAARTAIRDGYAAGALDAVLDGGEITGRFNRANTRAVDALVNETVTTLRSTHGQILRSTLDSYRGIISEVAAPGVVTGTQTRRQATQAALDRFAVRGITGFVDGAGRNWQIESYAEMATRTASGRAQIAGTLDRFVADGRDLVIVSDHTQECKLCRPWEGKVLSITGRTPDYPTVREAQSAGLQHPNCRHSLGAFIPGLTRPLRGTADLDGDRLRQEQRRLERGVRVWKRREAVAIGNDARAGARAHAREWQRRLREHITANDLKRLPYREQVTEPAVSLRNAVARYTLGGEWRRIVEAIKYRYSTGFRPFDVDADTPEAVADALLHSLLRAPARAPVLHRGVTPPMGVDVDQWRSSILDRYTPGATVDLRLASYTSDVNVAEDFAWADGIRFEVEAGSHALDIGADSRVPLEAEWLAGGRFVVLDVVEQADRTVIRLRQIR